MNGVTRKKRASSVSEPKESHAVAKKSQSGSRCSCPPLKVNNILKHTHQILGLLKFAPFYNLVLSWNWLCLALGTKGETRRQNCSSSEIGSTFWQGTIYIFLYFLSSFFIRTH